MIYWVKSVFDVSCFVKYSPWNLDVVAMRELIIAVSVGKKSVGHGCLLQYGLALQL